MPEEPFENRLDVIGPAEHPLEARAAAPVSEYRQVADRRVSGALAVDDDRRAALEVGLADEELAAAGKLDDSECLGRWR